MHAIGDYLVAAVAAAALVGLAVGLAVGGLLVLAYAHQARVEQHARVVAALGPPEGPLPAPEGSLPAVRSPLVEALQAGSAVLGGRAASWARDALGDTGAAPSRAVAEIVVLFLFWIVAVIGEFTYTVMRIGGIDGDPNASGGGGGLSWATGLVFVASISTYMGVLLATADHACFIPRARQRFFERVAKTGLVGVAVASASLTIAGLEAGSGVEDDPLLIVFWISFMVLVVMGTVICGHVSVGPLLLLVMAGLARGLEGGLRGAALLLRLRRRPAGRQRSAGRPAAPRAGTLTLLGMRLATALAAWRGRHAQAARLIGPLHGGQDTHVVAEAGDSAA